MNSITLILKLRQLDVHKNIRNLLIILILRIMTRRRSNTVGDKLKQINNEQSTNQKTVQSMILQQPRTIRIIIRRTNKPSRVIQIPQTISGSKLFEIVEKEYYIEQQKQILFFKGQRIQPSKETLKQTFSFSQRDILHVHNKQLIKRDSISIYMQFLNSDHVKFQQAKITVNSNQIIRNALEDTFQYQIQDIDKYLYVQSGRILNISRRLCQQAIQDDSNIIVLSVSQKPDQLRKLEQREMQIQQARTKLVKKSSLNYLDIMDTPDFKKKCRGHVYKSMILPQTKQIIWEQDSNSEFSKKILLKRLTKKKNIKPIKKQSIKQIIKESQRLSISSQFSSSPNNSKNGDKQLLQNIKLAEKQRLFCSQILPKKNQLLNFKPPPAMLENDDDFDEVDEIDFGCDLNDTDANAQCNDNCNGRFNCMKASAPLMYLNSSLTKSIGKMRGDFMPVIPFNNHKPDLDDSDDSDDSDDKNK